VKFDPADSWIQSVAYANSGSKHTEINYRRSLDYFCYFIGKTPQQILEEYENSEDRQFKRKYARFLRGFIVAMTSKGYTKGTVKMLAAGVQSFFKYNDLPLGHVPKAKHSVVYHNRDITTDEIREILNISTPREKAFFSVMTQSGLRPHVIYQLKLKHVELQAKDVAKIDVPKGMAKGKYMEHFSFIGKEALTHLRNYLKTRLHLTENSHLFSQYGKDAPIPRNTVSNSFHRTVVQLSRKGVINYEEVQGKPSEVRLYSLRKWFRKMAGQAGVDFVNFWMGHTSALGVDLHYFSKDVEHHREIYREKALPYLRIEGATPYEKESNFRQLEQKIEELEKKNLELKQRLNGFTLSSDQVQELLRRIEKLEKLAQKQG